MAQDRGVHALVYFRSAVDNLFGVIFYGGLDLEFTDMTKDEALKLALPAIYKLEGYAKNASLEFPYAVDTGWAKKDRVEAEAIITAIRKALAQPVQEPVAWVSEDVCNGQFINGRPRKIWWECSKGVGTAFYTTPPLPVQPDQSVAGYCKKIEELIVERDHFKALAQPAPLPVQEPVAWEQFHEHLVERNFCQRCGKRIADLITIHTCTPPQGNT